MDRGKTPFTIRPAVLADAESIVRVHHAAVHRSGATSYPREVLDAWRRGAGAMLLAELERLATGGGLTRLQLKSSLNAEPFYQASGYAVVGPGVHQIGAGLTMACVKMHKDLIPGEGRSVHC